MEETTNETRREPKLEWGAAKAIALLLGVALVTALIFYFSRNRDAKADMVLPPSTVTSIDNMRRDVMARSTVTRSRESGNKCQVFLYSEDQSLEVVVSMTPEKCAKERQNDKMYTVTIRKK